MRFFEVETELTDEEMAKEDKGLDEDTAVFSKSIPARVLLTPDRLDAILNSDKANLLLTKIQGEVLLANRPLLIHGQAGSGKTTVLCNRLALSIWHRNQQISRIAFLTYNEKLVKQAERDTDEILDLQYGYKGGLSGVSFRPLNAFLKQYVHDPSRFSTDKYVLYGRFKGYYEMYRRGNPVAKRVACEVAWHGIRSILKGACVPPLIPPLSHEKYDSLARKRRDFPDEIFEDIYAIGEWYQKEIIQKNGLWDDQDLAWAALKWIMDMQASKEKMLKYDEIFCDEGQDLTEIEFKILVSLCKQPLAAAEEGLPLVFAGDPLQTINPTGFKWSIIKNEVYNVQGKPVGLHYLKENFRSDKRIVKFANYIQKTRSYYLGQPVDEQLGFEKDGDIPQIIIADTQDEVALLQERLGELNQIPDVAVIVWPEGTDAIERFCKQEDALLKLDRTINPYSISEAKGLEFRLVVLYKFGSSDDMIRWKGYLAENKPIDAENEIPLLYFLNRLYVAVTRAKLFLVIVDTLSGVDNFLSIWKKAEQDKDVYLWSRADIRSFFDSHPAFGGDSSEEAWRQWAEKLFDYAERTRDLRLYERARRAFEKANETQNMKRVDARLAEIAEKWNDAGKLYFELNEFEPSRSCYSRAENWDGALKSTERLPTTPQTKRYLAIYKFETSRKQNANNSAVEFYEYAMTDNGIERRYLEELGAALIQSGDNSRAAQVLLGIAQRFADKAILIKAADSFFGARNFEYAEKLYLEAGETKAHSYYISRAENLLQKGEYIESARIFFENGSPEKVVKIFEQSEREKGSSPKGQLLEIAADSFFKLGRFDRALPAYKSLLTDLGRSQDGKILGQIGQCLEILGDKFGAYERYRDARLYKKAADLGVEIGVPDEQIIRLRTREAMDNNDFEKAAKLAYNSEDEKLVHITAGQYYAHKRDFVKAIPEFTKAEMWKEALDSIIQAQTQAGGHYIEELDQSCNFLLSIAKSQETLDPQIKDQVMRIVGQVEDDPSWETRLKPSEMGKVYEKCAHFEAAARYYNSRAENWAKEGWLKVKRAQLESFKTRREFDKASQIEKEIFLSRALQGVINLEDECNKEQTEILRETDKVKNAELSTTQKHLQYVNTVAYYLEKHIPANLKLVKSPFITELPTQFSLLLVKESAIHMLEASVPSYKLEDIAVAIEVRGHGWVEKADELEEAVKRKKDCFDEIKAKSKGIKCLYLTLEERRKAKDGMDSSYHSLSKKYLGVDYYSLRDSVSKIENPHEWENFVKTAVSQ